MQGVLIRKGVYADVEALLEIETRAAKLLLDHGGHDLLAMHALSADDLQRGIDAGLLHVAELEGLAVGFALAGRIDGHAHLFEMNVDPQYGRRGIGSRLLEAVCAAASDRHYPCMTLVTLREVPWNAPFYARRGFVEVAPVELQGQLAGLVERERMLGLPPGSRVVMRRVLPSSGRQGEKGSKH